MKLFNNIGIVSSFICAVHCAITPLLLTFLPLWGLSLLADKTFEVIMLCLSGIFGILNLCFGIKKHKSYKALSLFSIGFGLSAIGNMFHGHIENHKHHEIFEPYIGQYGLKSKYNNVWNENILTFEFDYYNIILMGDVLEHIEEGEGIEIIKKLYSKCNQFRVLSN
jgi:hypothetical protein